MKENAQRFYLTAIFKLKSGPDQKIAVDKVEIEVNGKFIVDLPELYNQAVFASIRKLGTSKLKVISIKLERTDQGYKFIANVMIQDKPEKVEFTERAARFKPLELHRLFQRMEASARSTGKDFESLVHLRLEPLEKGDITAEKF